jgi:DNA-binding transcriptional MerR regulator
MSDASTRHASHLSIGEVLALLLEEFPDVTISKIRFLESQGLIDPERTASGYRKFYDGDVELLRCILREQRENYLPLRVIKDRIDSGEIDPTGENKRPRGIRNVELPSDAPSSAPSSFVSPVIDESTAEPVTGAAALFVRTDEPPAPTRSTQRTSPRSAAKHSAAPTVARLPGVLLNDRELCSATGLTAEELADLESYGVIVADRNGLFASYSDEAVEIARLAKQFLEFGVDARHLRSWRVAADREAGLFDQLVQPLLRQRNPTSRAHAGQQLADLERLGGQLRSAMVREALHHPAP